MAEILAGPNTVRVGGADDREVFRQGDQLRALPDRFGEVARAWSDCPSATQGGQLGQIGPGDTVPAFEAACMRV